MTKKQTQAYTEEFRKEAVRRAEQKGNTGASVGRELGISAQQIYNWRRHFAVDKPNQKWVTDITYIWVKDQLLYLAKVMDLFSRSIIGWSLDLTMTEQLNTDALKMAFTRRDIAPGIIVHSNRGVQYRAVNYQALIRSHGGIVSMSRRGNCWDNAVMESFYSRLKVGLIYAERYCSIDEAKSGIFEYIEVFYNRLRRHSALGYVSHAEFERISA